MANTRPTPVGFVKAACLVWLLLTKPKRFLELQAEDSKASNAVTNPEKEEGAFVVRRAFFKSLLLVLASGAVGYDLKKARRTTNAPSSFSGLVTAFDALLS